MKLSSIFFSIFFLSRSFAIDPADYLKYPSEFRKIVLSKDLRAECDAGENDERGPFGINFQEGELTHDFLVMTGVYRDTCRELEKKIKDLQKRHTKLILSGTGSRLFSKNNLTWRWQSVKTVDGKKCVSYFEGDCL